MNERDAAQNSLGQLRRDMRDFEIGARMMRYVSFNALALAAVGTVAAIEGDKTPVAIACVTLGGLAYAGLRRFADLETDSALECLTNIGRLEMRLEEDY